MKLQHVLIIASAVIFASCANNTNKKTDASEEEVKIESAKDFVEEIPLPSSNELAQSLIEAGAAYIFGETNPPENAEKYLTQTQQAINLGVYSADLSYLTVYQKKDDIEVYMKSFIELTNALNLNTTDDQFLERVKSNIENKDSLLIIIDEAHQRANNVLSESEREEVGLLILAGSWIEGIYLVEKTMEFANDIKPLWNIVVDNKKNLEIIIDLLGKVSEPSEDITKLKNDLTDISTLFEELTANKKEETKKALVEKIESLRADIIQ